MKKTTKRFLYGIIALAGLTATGVKIRYEIGPRRAGDLPEFWADASKAERILGWKTCRTLEEMCKDTWRWQESNPRGYSTQ